MPGLYRCSFRDARRVNALGGAVSRGNMGASRGAIRRRARACEARRHPLDAPAMNRTVGLCSANDLGAFRYARLTSAQRLVQTSFPWPPYNHEYENNFITGSSR